MCPPASKKRRTQSHCGFVKNDKVVSKLMNMSMLSSELGGSRPITSERKANSSIQARTMKEYMSSMDMRIISSMHEDVPMFGNNDPIRDIMQSKGLSF